MLKKIFGAVVAALLVVGMLPVSGLAVERYEVLQIGDEDAWVTELQEKLIELGYLKPPATGYYGTNTQSAVVSYQRDHGLSADGKAGPITRQSILGDAYTPITGPRDEVPGPSAQPSEEVPADAPSAEPTQPGDEIAASPEPTVEPEPGSEPAVSPEPTEPAASAEPGESQEPADPAASEPPLSEPSDDPAAESSEPPAEPSASAAPVEADALKLGDRGDAVSDLQRRLKELEYYDYSQITGYFGPVTEESVKKFERTNSLELDGVMSAQEIELLNSEEVKFYTMFPGDQGDDIYAMQERLIALEYMDPEATGYYGTATTLAVRLFQETNGLVADGTAGKETRALLYSDKALKNGEERPNDDDFFGADGTPSSGAAKLISVAESQTGKRYVYGASGPNAYDCSGLVYYALKGAGVSVSRMSSAGYATVGSWKTIRSKSDLQAGDLVFFKSDSSSSISHVGIYIGGGNIIHAAPSIGGVGVSTMSSGYYSRNFVTAKRVF